MACVIRALTRSAIKKTTRKNNKQQNEQKPKVFTAENQYLKLKSPSNNVKMKSDKTLTTQISFS